MELIPPIRTVPPKARPASYADYLQSPTWRKRRDAKLRSSGWHCERCQAKRDLQVHHRSYQRLGAELDEDLEVLCRSCHEGHHHKEGVKSHIGLYIQLVSDVVQQRTFESIGDLMEAVKVRCAKAQIPYSTEKLSRAVDIVYGKRRGIEAPPMLKAAIEYGKELPPISQSEAESILRQLGIPVAIRTIPKEKLVTRRHADRSRAFDMVMREIEATSARCDALELSDPSDAFVAAGQTPKQRAKL